MGANDFAPGDALFVGSAFDAILWPEVLAEARNTGSTVLSCL